MTNRRPTTLNRGKKILLAVAGSLAVAGPVIVGILIGFGHLPEIHAQSPVVTPRTEPVIVGITTQNQTQPALAFESTRVPKLIAQALPQKPAQGTPAVPAASALTAPPAVRFQDRRMVILLFDLDSMTIDEQTRLKEQSVKFIQTQTKPDDVVCVMVAGAGPGLEIVQDFTGDPATVQAAIQRITAGRADNTPPYDKFAILNTVAKMLRPFPEKKYLMYYSKKLNAGVDANSPNFRSTVSAMTEAQIAIFPIAIE